MKKTLKRLLCVGLCLVLLLGTAAVGGNGIADALSLTVAAETVGNCGADGDNVKWYWHEDSGLLEIKGDGAMANYVSDTPWYALRDQIRSAVIYDGVTSIGWRAFSCCECLANVTIPDSVKSIGYNAFEYCRSLVRVTIPHGVTSINDYTFYVCPKLADVTIPDSVTSIGNHAFGECLSFTSVTIPDSATSIGDYAFEYCRSLVNLTIGNGITSIGSYAFSYCSSLTDVTIPDSVTSIGSGAFSYCTNLTGITIPGSVTSIGDYAFGDCASLADVTIPDSVMSIGSSAFFNCTSLTAIRVGAGNSFYSSDAYGVLYNKGKTELIQYPAGNPHQSFTIPDSVTNIGNYAFYRCTNLVNITIPDSVTNIGNYAFYRCTNLVNITIPDSVTSIGDYAFRGCTSLASVTIPDNITNIGSWVFGDCTSLIRVTIPDSVTRIGDSAFSGCMSLASVMIGNSVTSIGSDAFFFCKNLADVTIPDSVTNIWVSAFQGCLCLKDVYYAGSEADRQNITIGKYNEPLQNAAWHYNYVDPNAHTHAFGTAWMHDETNHWHECACGEKSGTATHTFDAEITTPATTESAGVKIYTCTVCGFTKTEQIPPVRVVKGEFIRGNSADGSKAYAYRATVEFTADVPAGGNVQWYVDGQPAGNGATLTVADKKSSYTVTVVVTSPDGTQTADEEHVTIKADFWSRIVWFFTHLILPHRYRIKQ